MGDQCDQCKDPMYAYPDCDSELLSDIYIDNDDDLEYLDRSHYNEDGY